MASRLASCSVLALSCLSNAALAFQATAKGLLQEERAELAAEEAHESQLVEEEQLVETEQLVKDELPQAEESTTKTKQHKQLCHWGPNAWATGFSGRADTVWRMAVDEAFGKDSSNNISTTTEFGCNVPKFPWSWVEKIQALDHTKVHTYNFQGSYMFALAHQAVKDVRTQYSARNWLIDFAKENFTDIDVLKISDITESYTPLGLYDKSVVGGYDAHHPDKSDPNYFAKFDDSYFEEMSGSNFTLCPGGDRPWSMRFYEAIVAGSIPIIKSPELDMGAVDMWALWEIPYKFYNIDTSGPLVYRQDWVDYNMQLFIKYQTFHEGDNTLPLPANGKMPTAADGAAYIASLEQ